MVMLLIVGLALLVLGPPVHYIFQIRHDMKLHAVEAAKEFRVIIVDDYQRVASDNETWAGTYLLENKEKHEDAVNTFLSYINNKNSERLKVLWSDYSLNLEGSGADYFSNRDLWFERNRGTVERFHRLLAFADDIAGNSEVG
ncbi:MAG: hypothetical protein PF904_12285 [Kiritimatiellae bacterium]|jgi:hypothetical protein|nr:hypothetical protein [Kiritimatiellia bacterium]